MLMANQASRPARLALAVALAPLAGRALDALTGGGGPRRRPRARLAAAAALLCAQALVMVLALACAAAYVACS
jgi:hypothetical protein